MSTRNPISPKVIATGATGLGLAVVVAVTTEITPDAFDFLGQWGPLAYTLALTLAGALAGWLRTDPARADATRGDHAA
jgi:hypothetical protein